MKNVPPYLYAYSWGASGYVLVGDLQGHSQGHNQGQSSNLGHFSHHPILTSILSIDIRPKCNISLTIVKPRTYPLIWGIIYIGCHGNQWAIYQFIL